MSKRIDVADYLGKRYGMLTIIGEPPIQQGRTKVIVQCDCGNRSTALILNLQSGNTKSCGCKNNPKTHGLTGTRAYESYRSMIGRCYREYCGSYHNYGGRGVRVCDRWLETNGQGLLNFYEDMGECPEGHELDKDIKGGAGCLLYSPENCMWVTRSENSQVKRDSITKEEKEEWNRLYSTGSSVREIHRLTGRNFRTIRKYLNTSESPV